VDRPGYPAGTRQRRGETTIAEAVSSFQLFPYAQLTDDVVFLVYRMELDGKETLPPPRKLSEMDAPIPTPRPQTRFEEMEEMFGAIVGEIEERETFLAEMTTLGRGDKYELEIKSEIADRVNQLKGLDDALRSASGLR
jgi:hypothetical protein